MTMNPAVAPMRRKIRGRVAVAFLLASVAASGCVYTTYYPNEQGERAMAKTDPKYPGLSASDPGVTALARSQCDYIDDSTALGPRNAADQDESALLTTLAISGISLLVDQTAAFLKAAGKDRTDSTYFKTSFVARLGASGATGTPRCFQIAKRVAGGGDLFLELALHQGGGTGADSYFRLIPTRLEYVSPSKRYWLQGRRGRRTLALTAKFSEPGSTDTAAVMLNLGTWEAKSIADFNKRAFLTPEGPDSDLIGLAGPWFKLDMKQGQAAFNVEFVVTETTSQNALAGIVGEELSSQSDQLKTQIGAIVIPETPDQSIETDAANAALVAGFCRELSAALSQSAAGKGLAGSEIDRLNLKRADLIRKLQNTNFVGNLNALPELTAEDREADQAKAKLETYVQPICRVSPGE